MTIQIHPQQQAISIGLGPQKTAPSQQATLAGGAVDSGQQKGAQLANLKAVYGEKKLKAMGIMDCATCAERRYVDGSNDGAVSFKTPGKIAPEASAAVVMSHEMEHVSNERADAAASGREVVSQSVSLHASICPECGISYVAGGTTRTVTRGKQEYQPPESLTKGVKLDQKV